MHPLHPLHPLHPSHRQHLPKLQLKAPRAAPDSCPPTAKESVPAGRSSGTSRSNIGHADPAANALIADHDMLVWSLSFLISCTAS